MTNYYWKEVAGTLLGNMRGILPRRYYGGIKIRILAPLGFLLTAKRRRF